MSVPGCVCVGGGAFWLLHTVVLGCWERKKRMSCTVTREVANYHISQLSHRNHALDMTATELEFTSPLSRQPTSRKLFAFDDVSNANDLQHTYVGRVPLTTISS